jgi:hypothetical protein
MGEDIINLFFSDGQQGTEACSKAVNLRDHGCAPAPVIVGCLLP